MNEFSLKEPLAVNTITITEKLFNEGARDILRKKYNALALKVGGALAVVLAVLFFVSRAMGDSSFFVGEVVIFIAVIIWVRLSLPRSERKRAYHAISAGGEPTRRTLFYDDHFVVTSGPDEEKSFSYTDVTGIRTTEQLLILTLENKAEVLLLRSGFEHGTVDDIHALIESALRA